MNLIEDVKTRKLKSSFYANSIQYCSVKHEYNEHGYNAFMVIMNKNLTIF